MDGKEPSNKADEIAMDHDYEYGAATSFADVRRADDKFVERKHQCAKLQNVRFCPCTGGVSTTRLAISPALGLWRRAVGAGGRFTASTERCQTWAKFILAAIAARVQCHMGDRRAGEPTRRRRIPKL